MPLNASLVSRTTLCTTLDLGESASVSTVEHVLAALSGLGVDNASIVVEGGECPIMDGSAAVFADAIVTTGLVIQSATRRYLKVLRPVMVRNNESFAVLEPHNGRAFDVEIDFASPLIGRQRMLLDWSPRRFHGEVSRARTFGFMDDARALRQAGYAMGSSLDNSICLDKGRILNPGGLRYEDEFVRHKLLDAIGDLAMGGMPIYGRFRSFRSGHALNALALGSLFANVANYEVVSADDLPLSFDALDDVPESLASTGYLRQVG